MILNPLPGTVNFCMWLDSEKEATCLRSEQAEMLFLRRKIDFLRRKLWHCHVKNVEESLIDCYTHQTTNTQKDQD